MKISVITRRDIFDKIRINGINWSGELEEPDFLNRIFELKKMSSYDSRFANAYSDIWQHRINNYDWSDDWILEDERFNLLEADDKIFLQFLCEMLHPLVRRDQKEIEQLKQMFNESLRKDGYELVEADFISGRPIFTTHLYNQLSVPNALNRVGKAFEGINTDYIARQTKRMEDNIEKDPDLAIGTAKELVETVCKTILHEREIESEDCKDLPQLVKKTVKELALTPDDIPEKAKAIEIIRRILSNLATITQGIAELRNYYGTGHGKKANAKGLQPRHAKLVVGAASTLSVFLYETHKIRTDKET